MPPERAGILTTERLALLGIVVLAVILRGIGLGDSSLEHLEASYLFEAIKPDTLWGVVTSRQSAEQMHQPLYPLLLRGWVAMGGVGETWLRLPSLVFSVAAVGAVWALARPSLGRRGALWAAALTATAPLLVWYGRDASPYALLAILSLAAAASGAAQLRNPRDRRGAIRTGILLSLAFYTHFHGGWVAITIGLWLLVRGGMRFRSLWYTTGITAALCLPWLPALVYKLTTSVQGLERDQALMRYSHALTEALPEAARLLVGGEHLAWGAGLAGAIAGAVMLLRQKNPLGTLIGVACLIGLVAELHILWQLERSKGILYVDVRHYVYLGPILMLGPAALGRRRAGAAIAAVALALQTWTSVTLVRLEKPDVRSAMAYVREHATGPTHGIGYLPAPWYQPIVELYLTGPCERLVHAHSREGWWSLDDCFYSEFPVENSVYGFPPDADRLRWAAMRQEIQLLWMVDIHDHRFGLPTPPTTLQEQYLCWPERENALVRRKTFGPWVTVSVYDARRLQTSAEPPPRTNKDPVTVTSEKSWELTCRNPGKQAVE